MIKSYFTFAFILTSLLIFTMSNSSNTAHAQYEIKDSFYFMKDDGEFSDEEKDEEAEYIYQTCNNNSIQSTYFDCACLAGAFRQERDKEKLVPQANLINSVLTDNSRGCANTAQIAGETYEFCTEYARSFRSRKKDNEGYCKCVANTMANSFKKNPIMRRKNIQNLRTEALGACR